MAKRGVPEINAGSMADIAFLLLIFFLVTTTMSVDSGITRKLPPWNPDTQTDEGDKAKARNVYMVLINKDNQLMVENDLADVSFLTEMVKNFYQNPKDDENLSEGPKVSSKLEKMEIGTEEYQKMEQILTTFGDVKMTKGIVSLQNDRGTSYDKYIEVQNELVRAINEMRDEIATQTFGNPYDECNEDQQDLIQLIYPLSISEAEPKSVKK